MEDSTRLGYAGSRMYAGDTEPEPMIAAFRAVRAAPPAERDAFWDALRASLSVTTPELEAEHEERKRQRRTARPAGAVVYYLRFGDRVKIGYTTNLPQRLKALPHDEVLATESGTLTVERERHQAFADLRIKGEWFHYSEPLVSHIAGLQ